MIQHYSNVIDNHMVLRKIITDKILELNLLIVNKQVVCRILTPKKEKSSFSLIYKSKFQQSKLFPRQIIDLKLFLSASSNLSAYPQSED